MDYWIFDSHVHLYKCFDLSLLLSKALENAKALVNTQDGENLTLFLGIASTAKETQWSELVALAEDGKPLSGAGGDWQLGLASDSSLLRAEAGGAQIYLVPGQQINSSEGLELILMGAETPKVDASKTLAWHLDANPNHLNIVPWGVGKWLGKRGQVVLDLVASDRQGYVLGDNGGRPALWSKVKPFDVYRAQSMQALPGTDPLPIAGEEAAVAKNAVGLRVDKGQEPSFSALQSALESSSLDTFHSAASLFGFIRNQLLIRM